MNYQDHGGNSAEAKRAFGILRSCMQGPAAIWFDRELTGKNWRLTNMNKNGVALLNVLRALVIPEGAGGPNAGTYVAGSPAQIYSGVAGNALQTIGEAFIPPVDALTGQASRDASLAWDRVGAEPVRDAPNPPRNNAGGNGAPLVFEGIDSGQAFYWMRKHLPAMQDERRRLRFSSIYQDNLPIKDYYEKISRAEQLLNFGNEVINDQFFRGLTPDNAVEIERIGLERPVDELVRILERVEKRKAEVYLGFNSRKALEEHRLKKVEPVQAPPLTRQEPVEIKPVASHAITQDMLDKLLQQHNENLTKNFQTQLQTLQDKVSQLPPPEPPVYHPVVPPKNWGELRDYHEGGNPYRVARRGYDYDATDPDNIVNRVAQRVARRIAKAKEQQEDRDLARAMQGLGLGDREDNRDNDAMDVDLVRIGDAVVSQDDLNEYFANLLRSKKK